ncbi:MAG TPA: hypothetical protein DCZ47_03875 [Candidatus Magasanikbacteria bacterium]|nr:hypothetical protein [Candidatus Magasanikbacteria bacterium]
MYCKIAKISNYFILLLSFFAIDNRKNTLYSLHIDSYLGMIYSLSKLSFDRRHAQTWAFEETMAPHSLPSKVSLGHHKMSDISDNMWWPWHIFSLILKNR